MKKEVIPFTISPASHTSFFSFDLFLDLFSFCAAVACVASVSVWFPSKERGTTVKDRAKKSEMVLKKSAAKTKNRISRSYFALKPHGNACYAG